MAPPSSVVVPDVVIRRVFTVRQLDNFILHNGVWRLPQSILQGNLYDNFFGYQTGCHLQRSENDSEETSYSLQKCGKLCHRMTARMRPLAALEQEKYATGMPTLS